MRRLAALGVGALVVATVPVAPADAARRTPTSAQQKLRQLRQLVGEASAEEARLVDQVTEVRARRQKLDAAVKSLDGQIAFATAGLRRAEADVERLDGGFLDLTQRLADTEALIARRRALLRTVIADLYRQEGGESEAIYASLVVHARSPHDVFAAGQYLIQVASRKRADIDRLQQLRDAGANLRDQLDTKRTDARAARDRVAAERARLDALRVQQAQAQADAVAEEQQEQRLLQHAQSRKAEFERQLAALQAESSSIARMLRGRQAGQVLQPSGHGVFAIPVSAPVTSGFGPRVHPIFGDVRMHNGVDFGAGMGAPIRAGGAGVVAWAGPRGGYGNCTIIDHGNGLATLYAHQSRIGVGVGQRVRTGQTIGSVGATGYATGPHLHFEVRRFGTPVDPIGYL